MTLIVDEDSLWTIRPKYHYDEEGFMLEYIPEKCALCDEVMEPMLPYYTITVSNTEEPELTVYHFDSYKCFAEFLLKNPELAITK